MKKLYLVQFVSFDDTGVKVKIPDPGLFETETEAKALKSKLAEAGIVAHVVAVRVGKFIKRPLATPLSSYLAGGSGDTQCSIT